MYLKASLSLTILIGLTLSFINNATAKTDHQSDQPYQLQQQEQHWVDKKRKGLQNSLNGWATKIDDYFGEIDPNDPASVNLRVIVDTRWNKYDNITIEPRVRANLHLPVLENRLSLIIGDDSLDEETLLTEDTSRNSPQVEEVNIINEKQARDDNASIAVRWTEFGEKLGLQTDVDLGIRSVDDVFFRVDIDKDIQLADKLALSSDNLYRYGTKSEHYARGDIQLAYNANDSRTISNRTHVIYTNKDNEENISWGNSTRQIQTLDGNRQFSYGLTARGDIEGGSANVNSYGPVISYRQPIWHDWLFAQTEVTYYNDKAKNRNHHPAGLIRLEALF